MRPPFSGLLAPPAGPSVSPCATLQVTERIPGPAAGGEVTGSDVGISERRKILHATPRILSRLGPEVRPRDFRRSRGASDTQTVTVDASYRDQSILISY